MLVNDMSRLCKLKNFKKNELSHSSIFVFQMLKCLPLFSTVEFYIRSNDFMVTTLFNDDIMRYVHKSSTIKSNEYSVTHIY